MSAGGTNSAGLLTDKQVLEARCNKVEVLPSVVQVRLKGFLGSMLNFKKETFVFETERTDLLQQHYYAIGSSHARTRFQSWHGHCLGIDCLQKGLDDPWSANSAYWFMFAKMAARWGFSWGGNWTHIVDKPHIQPKELPDSPTAEDMDLIAAHGKERVWAKYGLVKNDWDKVLV